MHPRNKWLVGLVSTTLISSVSLWEGTRYYAYYDVVGVPTVCMGYTGSGIIFGKKYSSQECNAFLRKELEVHTKGMLDCINVPLTENQYNAFSLFTYNVGVNAFCSSTVRKKLNQGDYVGACKDLGRWVYAGGKFVQGLANRRAYETKMCLGE